MPGRASLLCFSWHRADTGLFSSQPVPVGWVTERPVSSERPLARLGLQQTFSVLNYCMAPDFEEVQALISSAEDNNDAGAQCTSKRFIHLISSCQFLALSFPGLPF